MKAYSAPVIIETSSMMEGVYAASGALPTPEPTTEPESNDWTFTNVEWRGHNGGSHSEGHIDAHYSGPANTAFGVKIKCITNFDFELNGFDGCGSCEISAEGTRTFTITRRNGGYLNPNENIGINFKLVAYVPEYVKENGTQGAVGDSDCPNDTKYYFQIVGWETI